MHAWVCMGPASGVVPWVSHRGPGAWGASKQRGQSPCLLSGYICQCVIASKHQAGLASKLDKRLGSQTETIGSARSAPATGVGLGNPCVRVPAAGEMGDPGPVLGQTECLKPASREIHMVCI